MAKRAKVKLISNFAQVDAEMAKQVPPAVFEACFLLRDAWIETLSGDRTGRVYRVPGTKRALYTASAPGEAPASATGRLRQSIRIMPRVRRRDVQCRVGSELEYALYLEYGTETMQPRPHLEPSFRSVKRQMVGILRGAFKHGAVG